MKPKPEDATIEQILHDVSYWEDPDQMLLIQPDNDDGSKIRVMPYDCYSEVIGSTLKEALILFGRKSFGQIIDEEEAEGHYCDWSVADGAA